jgi:bacteriocin-like protein
MSDEKPVKDDKELKDEELNKVSGGAARPETFVKPPVSGHQPPNTFISERDK